MADTHLSILNYIKSGKVSLETEINHLEAGEDIHIIIRDFFSNSPDYQKLKAKIDTVQDKLNTALNDQARLAYSTQLNNLYKLEKAFKVDILNLAGIFTRIDLRTERLRQAAALFDQGRFQEADAILKEQDLAKDQHHLFVRADYLEWRKGQLWDKWNDLMNNDQESDD